MHYVSTRDKNLRYSGAQAIVQGLSRDGGLFLPEEIPALPEGKLREMAAERWPEAMAEPDSKTAR